MAVRAVSSLPLFAARPASERRALDRNLDLVDLPAGQSVLLGRGPAAELLLVVDGYLAALGGHDWVARPGAVLGAQALLSGTAQPHGFRALQPVLVAFAGVGQTRALMSSSPAFATAVALSLSEELCRRPLVR